jgi:hypothetical protein
MRRLVLTCLVASAALAPVRAGTPARFPQIDYGFKELRGRGLAAAVTAWTYESRVADPARLAEKVKAFATAEQRLGECVSHQIVATVPVGGGSTLVLASAQFRGGTVFFRLLNFDSGSGETVSDVAWSVDPFDVWPDALVARLQAQ